MSDAIVKDTNLLFEGRNYFRGRAESVQLWSYGVKKFPITPKDYIVVRGQLPVRKPAIGKVAVVTIDFDKTTEKDLLANINVSSIFNGASDAAYQYMKSGRLKLVRFEVANEDILSEANESPDVVEKLIECGSGARIVNEIFVVMHSSLADSFASGASLGVSLSGGAVKIIAEHSAGPHGNTSITLSKGTTFAYGMLKLDWDANQKNLLTKISGVANDQWGL